MANGNHQARIEYSKEHFLKVIINRCRHGGFRRESRNYVIGDDGGVRQSHCTIFGVEVACLPDRLVLGLINERATESGSAISQVYFLCLFTKSQLRKSLY